jgi:hypothetical protein
MTDLRPPLIGKGKAALRAQAREAIREGSLALFDLIPPPRQVIA